MRNSTHENNIRNWPSRTNLWTRINFFFLSNNYTTCTHWDLKPRPTSLTTSPSWRTFHWATHARACEQELIKQEILYAENDHRYLFLHCPLDILSNYIKRILVCRKFLTFKCFYFLLNSCQTRLGENWFRTLRMYGLIILWISLKLIVYGSGYV